MHLFTVHILTTCSRLFGRLNTFSYCLFIICICVSKCFVLILHILNEFLHISGLCIPSNNTIFIKQISEKLAQNASHLTLEFLEECIQGFRSSTIELKHLCLEYMTPWLPNLTR